MTDITHLNLIDGLIAHDLPKWERDGDEPYHIMSGETYVWMRGSVFTAVFHSGTMTHDKLWRLHRKRPATVTVELPYIFAEGCARASSSGSSHILNDACRRALEALREKETN